MTVTRALARSAPYTADDLFGIPDDGQRYEVCDGALITSPTPTQRHQRAVERVRAVLRDALPVELDAVTGTAVRLDQGTGFVPDIVVTGATPDRDRPELPANQALTVVEVVCPTTRTQDRVSKPARYAEAGIPCYWRVELDAFPVPAGRPVEPPSVVVTVAGFTDSLTFGAGRTGAVPVVVAHTPTGPALIQVRFDPAALR
jgi:Uma2 family endonuclease